jgi:hypothetical protein
MAVARAVSMNTARASVEPFHLLVTEQSRVYLLSEPLANSSFGPFSSLTRVFANDVPCNVSWVAADGRLLQFDIPPRHSLCPDLSPDDDKDCGYLQLTLSTHSDANATGATLSCPPFCPNDFLGSVPLATIDQDGSIAFVPAVVGTGDAPPVPVSLRSLPSTGIYMTQGCAAAGFLDPSLGICANASDSRHMQCAFGAGATCRSCPTGALCPGGYRAWPQAGFFTATESSGIVIACSAPAQLRCTGWNSSVAQVQCGNGYLPGSFACGSCASGYYPALDGTCVACPYDGRASALDILLPIVIFCASLAAACGLVYSILVGIARLRGAPTTGLLKSVLQLSAWVFLTVQVVAQVGRSASPGMPPFALVVYTQLSIFQFRGAALPSACIPGSPFTNEVVSMSVALGMLVIAALSAFFLLWKSPQLPSAHASSKAAKSIAACATAFRGSILCLALLYATVTNAVISTLHCSDVNISEGAYAALTGVLSSSSFAIRNTRTVAASLLQSNPSVVCYSDQHISVAVLAWITAGFYCTLYPICAVILVSWRIKHLTARCKSQSDAFPATWEIHVHTKTRSKSEASSTLPTSRANLLMCNRVGGHVDTFVQSNLVRDYLLAPFVGAEYHPRAFWFPVVDRVYFVVLALAQAFLPVDAAVPKFVVIFIALMFMLVLLTWHRPYVATWKLVVKVYSLLLCLVAACLNMVTAENPGNPGVVPLSFIVVVLSVGLFVALSGAFLHDVLSGMQTHKVISMSTTTKVPSIDSSQQHSNPLLTSTRDSLPRRIRMTPQHGGRVSIVGSGNEISTPGRARQVRPSVIMTSPQLSMIRRKASQKVKLSGAHHLDLRNEGDSVGFQSASTKNVAQAALTPQGQRAHL